jgi:Ca-activated chloride channel family protein
MPALKYQKPTVDTGVTEEADRKAAELSELAMTGELATVRLNYVQPDREVSEPLEFIVAAEPISFSQADEDSRFAAAVAAFGMRLRSSIYGGSMSYEAIAEIAGGAKGEDPQGYRAEFVELVRKAAALSGGNYAAPADAARE